jgi:hypothetical protein
MYCIVLTARTHAFLHVVRKCVAYRFIWKDGGGEAAVRRDLQYFGYNNRFELSHPCRTATLVVHADNAIDLAGCKFDVSAACAAAANAGAQPEAAQE